MRALTLMLVLYALCACSAFGTGVPDRIPTTYQLRCTSVPPILDSAFAVAGVGLAIEIERAQPARSPTQGLAKVTAGVLAGILIVGNGLSAAGGWVAWRRCKRLRDSPPLEYAKVFAVEGVSRAEAGDCRSAMSFGARVADFDRAYYAHTFLSHPAIVSCVASANALYRAEQAERRREAEVAARRGQARELLTQARRAAKVGDCAAVALLGTRIQVLDTATYTVWFAKDPEIARCSRGAVGPP